MGLRWEEEGWQGKIEQRNTENLLDSTKIELVQIMY